MANKEKLKIYRKLLIIKNKNKEDMKRRYE